MSPRIEEYTRYLVASNYSKGEVMKAMEECRGMDRNELIRRPRKSSRPSGPKKMIFTPKWERRDPHVHQAMTAFKTLLYTDKENEKAFPNGTPMCPS